MDVDRFNDLALQACGVYFINIRLDFVLCPNLACRLVIKEAHQAGHTRNLLNLLQGDAVALGAVPAERHFHVFRLPPFLAGTLRDKSQHQT